MQLRSSRNCDADCKTFRFSTACERGLTSGGGGVELISGGSVVTVMPSLLFFMLLGLAETLRPRPGELASLTVETDFFFPPFLLEETEELELEAEEDRSLHSSCISLKG